MTRRILGIFAHPDDETFLAGGTLAKYAASGWEVDIVCATLGEAGRRGNYEKESLSLEEFGRVRQREMKAACEILGVRPPVFLECADQGVLKECMVAGKEEVTRFLLDLKPDVVITFGPDGVSGHVDHVAMHRIVTGAVLDGHPSPSPSLYYVLRSDLLTTCCKPESPVQSPPVTTIIDVSGFVDRKLAAMRCYKSQEHLLSEDRGVIRDTLTGRERFHRRFPTCKGEVMEYQLFTQGAEINS